MPPLLKLSDAELDQIFAACRPLEPSQRDAFLQAIAVALRSCPEVGPGVIHRTIATVQRAHWDPPLETGHAGAGKYSRSG
jgi:hypothetical protein